MPKLIYLASPYTSPLPGVQAKRYEEVRRIAGKLIKEKRLLIFCPIVYAHHLNIYEDLGGKFEEWIQFDLTMIERCDELWVVMMQGWTESVGVTAEIQHAQAIGKTIRYVHPESLHVSL